MSTHQRPFALAVEAVTLSAGYIAGQGWHVQIAMRRQLEQWGDAAWTHYDGLTTAEMLDVIDGHLSSHL